MQVWVDFFNDAVKIPKMCNNVQSHSPDRENTMVHASKVLRKSIGIDFFQIDEWVATLGLDAHRHILN